MLNESGKAGLIACPTWLERQAKFNPNEIFFGDGAGITYDELNQMADRICTRLRQVGLQGGEKVGLLLQNRLRSITIAFGIVKAGGVPVSISSHQQTQQLSKALTKSRIAFLFTHSHFMPLVYDQWPALNRIRDFFVVGQKSSYEGLDEMMTDSGPPPCFHSTRPKGTPILFPLDDDFLRRN